MNTKKIILFGFIALLLGSCVNYLEPYPQGNKDSENIWQYSENIQGLIGQCYDNMNSKRNYNDNEGTYLDGATDDAVITSSTNNIRRLAVNALTTGNDPFLTYWERDYRAIRNANFFLEGRRGYNTRFVIQPHFNDLVKNRLQGEAFAIRAWHEWDLLQKFGGEGAVSHQMMGFPIVTEVIGLDENMNLRRNTYDECVAQILADCDSAYKYLPIAHRDFLVPSADRSYAGGKYWGRFDGITMRALKSLVYLTWASPRFNPGNLHAERWDSAANNAKKVINFKLNVDIYTGLGGANAFNPTKPVIWTNPNYGGIVMTSRYNTGNDEIERMLYPNGFQGNGQIGATQELVNSFPMKNGRPITDPLSLYDPANPYANRDPRFYSAIFYNTGKAYRNNTATAPNLMYTFETWSEGPNGPGKDAAGVSQNNSLTNYHIKKFIAMTVNWNDLSVSRQAHSKFFIRWDHMVLAFAEAANHVTHNPNNALYGLTPKAALAYLRTRPSYDNTAMAFGADPYLTEVANAGEAAFDALVKNERRIELCFEGTRFYDLRRWTTDANWQSVLNQPVHGALVKQKPDLTFTYDLVNYEVEKRAFQSPYLPIPYQEVMRVKDLEQNVGWETWN